MPQYMMKPIVVDAIRWSGRKRDIEEVFALVQGVVEVIGLTATGELHIDRRKGGDSHLLVQPGEWLVRDGDRLKAFQHDAFIANFNPVPVP